MQRWVVICWALLALVGADECPDGGRCEEGQTCCSHPDNGYECCPFDQAECCEDHMHCCPAETICDVATSSCVNATVSVPWVDRAPADKPMLSKSFRMIRAYKGEDEENICPDNSRCPPEYSCLKALTKYGCCPLAQGVSCSDGKHCCPESHQCSEDSRSCIKKEFVTSVLCGDGVSECPDGTTCCETTEGKWACCPMPKAVCCEDKLHCCPEGTTCDTEHDKCISTTTRKEMPMWAKMPARIRAEWEDQKSPEQVSAKTANEGDEKAPEVTTVNSVPPTEEEVTASSVTKAAAGDVPCNDTAACPDNTTCCKTKEGEWSCCPLPEATCCEDFIHCCPHGKKCNLAAQTCDDEKCSMPWVAKVPVMLRERVKVKDVPCNSTAGCPDGSTCCKTQEGEWSCCPLPEATCCEDFIHCCPHGKKCNLAAQTCDGEKFSVPWVAKVPVMLRERVKVEDVPCNSTASCPDGSTCCKTKAGEWACCPLPEAVCCDDHEHCCPSGTTCDLTTVSCTGSSGSVPMQRKMPAFTTEATSTQTTKAASTEQTENVPCDNTACCPDGTTCCKAKTGLWACCPLPEAVCCDDHEHCCPSGTTCDPTSVSCTGSSGSVPMQRKIPAFTTEATSTQTTKAASTEQTEDETMTDEDEAMTDEDEAMTDEEENNKEVEGRIKCDYHTSCPRSSTCCFMSSSQKWGCCPLPEAACCADGNHCCPSDYRCNEAETSCTKGEVVIPWYTKLPATTSVQAEPSPVQCDSQTRCPDHTTCCKLATGEWACCPLENAVCCPDKEHCCPQGYTCNIASNSCQKVIMLQLESLPLTPVFLPEHHPEPSVSDVKCDDKTSCEDGETCCKISATEWGCCPFANAVCCSDLLHCCPSGYTCTDTGDCKKDTRLHWFNWRMFYGNKKRALIA